jgi:hypothetical protein
MSRFEYKVLPAPKKPGKIKGVRGTEAKFAAAISHLINDLAAEGWEYQRTDTLPCEERQGFTGRVTTFQNMLVFRREVAAVEAAQPAPAPVAETVAAAPAAQEAAPAPRLVADAAEAPVLSFRSGAQSQSAPAAPSTPAITPARDIPEGKAPPISLHRGETRPEHVANG